MSQGNDPVKKLQDLANEVAQSAQSADWEGAGEVAKKLQELRSAASNLSSPPKEDQEDPADAFIRIMQELEDAGTGVAKRAKGQADAAEAARDKAKKATTKKKAVDAASEAEHCLVTAKAQAGLVYRVQGVLDAASEAVKDGPKRENAESVATKARVDASDARQYEARAKKALDAAKEIAKTA